MKKNWENWKATLDNTVLMSKREYLLTLAVCILGGIVFGILFSPKKEMTIGSNNGSNNSGSFGGNEIEDLMGEGEDEE